MTKRKNGKRAKRKSTAKSAAKRKPATQLVAQPHGGALWSKGTPNPVAGTGRPPSVVRARALGSFDQRIGVVEEIADGVAFVNVRQKCIKCGHEPAEQKFAELVDEIIKLAPTAADRLRAVDVLGKYGLGERGEITVVSPDVRARLSQTLDAVRELLPADQAETLLDRLEGIWR